MSKTCKKLLASAIAATMLISTFVSSLVVSAANVGTLTIGTTEITQGTTEAEVTLTYSYDPAVAAPHNLITIDSDFDLTAVELVSVNGTALKDFPVEDDLIMCPVNIAEGDLEANLAEGKILLGTNMSENNLVSEIVLAASFTVPANAEAKTYAISATSDYADYDEAPDDTVAIVDGSIVVKAAHVCEAGTAVSNDNGTHDIPCVGCDKLIANDEPCTYGDDGACTVCGYKEPVVGPEEDSSITATLALNITEKINARILISKEVANYADYDIVISRQKAYRNTANSNVYDLTEVQEFVYDKGEEVTVMADGRGALLYNDIAMYEIGIDFSIQVKCYDTKGNYVAYSIPVETSVGKLAREFYNNTSSKAALYKNVAIDIAKLGDKAQAYMVNGKSCGLATVPSSLALFPADATDGATFDASALDTTNTPVSYVDGVSFAPAVNVSSNPCIRLIASGTGTTYPIDTLSIKVDYTNGKNGSDAGKTIPGSELTPIGSGSSVRYALLFDSIALYDGNVPITATLYSGETPLAAISYSVEAYIANNAGDSLLGQALIAVANLGTSARAFFEM